MRIDDISFRDLLLTRKLSAFCILVSNSCFHARFIFFSFESNMSGVFDGSIVILRFAAFFAKGMMLLSLARFSACCSLVLIDLTFDISSLNLVFSFQISTISQFYVVNLSCIIL